MNYKPIFSIPLRLSIVNHQNESSVAVQTVFSLVCTIWFKLLNTPGYNVDDKWW